MKIICAWCEQEGRPAFMGERAPLVDERATHGICRGHLLSYLSACCDNRPSVEEEATLTNELTHANCEPVH